MATPSSLGALPLSYIPQVFHSNSKLPLKPCLIGKISKQVFENCLFPYSNLQDLAVLASTNITFHQCISHYINFPKPSLLKVWSNQFSEGIEKLQLETFGPSPTHPILLRQWLRRLNVSQRVMNKITSNASITTKREPRVKIDRQWSIICAECGNKFEITRKLDQLIQNIILCSSCQDNLLFDARELSFAWSFAPLEISEPLTYLKREVEIVGGQIKDYETQLASPSISAEKYLEIEDKLIRKKTIFAKKKLLLDNRGYHVFGFKYISTSGHKKLSWFTSDLMDYRLKLPLNPKIKVKKFEESSKRIKVTKGTDQANQVAFNHIAARMQFLPPEFQASITIDEDQQAIIWSLIPNTTIDTIFADVHIDVNRRKLDSHTTSSSSSSNSSSSSSTSIKRAKLNEE